MSDPFSKPERLRDALRGALHAIERYGENSNPEELQARDGCLTNARKIRSLGTPTAPEVDPLHDPAVLRRIVDADKTSIEAEYDAAVAGEAPGLVSASTYANHPQPEPILWRDDPNPNAPSTAVDAVVSVGEVAVFASAGGLGKSTFVLEVVSTAVAGGQYGAACGLRIAPGPVVFVSYEDSPARIAHRLKWMNSQQVPAEIHLAADPPPLWHAAADRGGQSTPADWWPALWRGVRQAGARLVVIDPVSAALADVSTSETGPVRAFMRALTREAAPDPDADWPGCGVLLVAHDTKSSRNAAARGEDPGAGAVAGSAAWFDGARGVLTLRRHATHATDRVLTCIKANYGRTGWGAHLEERTVRGIFNGFVLRTPLDEDQVAQATTPPPKPKAKAGGKKAPSAPVDTPPAAEDRVDV